MKEGETMTLDARDKAIVLTVWQQWAEHGRCTYRDIVRATGIPLSTVKDRMIYRRSMLCPDWIAEGWWSDVDRMHAGALRPGPLVGGVLVNRRTGERTLLRRIEG